MNTTLSVPPSSRTSLTLPRVSRETLWTGVGLTLIVILAIVLRFGNLSAIGQSNTYYTAAIDSMLQSWRNFFFVAAEPGGSVSIDKPPLGLWLEAISAYFLGVSGFATVLPNLLAGVGSVLVLFHLIRRSFGNIAGMVAALALAVTPVAIAVERNNTPDGVLVFTLLLAAWAFIKATETRRLRYLLLGATLVGLGFNIKMMQAYLPLPAFYALYFLGSAQSWRRKFVHLALATVVLVAVSLSWAVAVDLTPADRRPYVGSSGNNSVLSLMLGYNGLQRLTGASPAAGSSASTNGVDGAPPEGLLEGGLPGPTVGLGGGPTGNANGMFGTGQVGLFRLFQSGLAAQASWLLPLGLLFLLALTVSQGWWRPYTVWHHGVILWGGWLLTSAAFFSVAGFFHQYYLIMLGAPLAALVGLGLAWAIRMYRTQPVRTGLFLIAAAITTMVYQVYAVSLYETLSWWLVIPAVLALAGVAVLALDLWRPDRWSLKLSLALIVAALFVAPTVWSGLTTAYASVQGPMPQAYAGQTQGRMGQGGLAMGGSQGVDQELVNYLQTNTTDTKYLLVTTSSQSGAAYVLATGRPVLYAGGFNGSDTVITGDDLAQLVAQGDVRYVLWGDSRGGPGGGSNSSFTSITAYLQSSRQAVPGATTTAVSFGGPGGGASTLYLCGG